LIQKFEPAAGAYDNTFSRAGGCACSQNLR
jgi:hypothetical protein